MLNWDYFFRENEKKAFVIALNYLRNRDDALDVVQDAMIAMHKNYSNIESEKEAKALFYKILNNKLTDKYRSLKRVWNRFTETEEDIENLVLTEDSHNFLLHKEMEKALKKLTSTQQRIFLLKTVEEFTFKEISEMMGVSESTCKTHYSRSLKKIKESVN